MKENWWEYMVMSLYFLSCHVTEIAWWFVVQSWLTIFHIVGKVVPVLN
jgi:hypothetical protein